MNKKKLIIIIVAAIIMIALLIWVLLMRKNSTVPAGNNNNILYTPEFMDSAEKAAFELPENSKIQVLKRDGAGSVEVYKIIREDADVIFNLEEAK